MDLALRARPLPHRERHARHLLSTLGADLAARIPTVHYNDRLSPLCRLVFSLPPEFAKAHIRNLPSELVIFEHPGHVEIRNGDHIKSLNAQGSPLVQGIRPDIRNPGMQPGQTALCFLHVLRPGNRHAFGDRLAGL